LNEQAFRNLVSKKTTGLWATMARSGLGILSLGYRSVIALRNSMFDCGLRKPRRVAVPVISVGNLTTGGTGKTPVVAMIVELLVQQQRRPAIVSRGYGSVDGEANDEKRVLERICPGIPHEQNRSRFHASESALQASSPDVIVMDDGFQHRQLHRDLNIVLIDATNPFGYGSLLPRGLLREPLSSLQRADMVLVTRADMVLEEGLSSIEQQIARSAPHLANRIYRIAFRPTGFISGAGQRFSLTDIAGQSVILVSGIGNPEAFESTCRHCGLTIAGTQWFPDHHHYSPDDHAAIQQMRQQLGATHVVTTLKDLVKLPGSGDFLALEIAAGFQDEGQAIAFRIVLENV
jgi:tetraacyldisaccharide 4'-kinase